MSWREKKQQVLNELSQRDLDGVFEVTGESEDGVLLQAEQTMGNGRCVISLTLNDRPFNCIYYSLGKLNNLGRKDAMLDLLNSFNEGNLMLKFFINDSNNIMCLVTYIAIEDSFQAYEYVALISSAFNSIDDEFYSRIMRVMWG